MYKYGVDAAGTAQNLPTAAPPGTLGHRTEHLVLQITMSLPTNDGIVPGCFNCIIMPQKLSLWNEKHALDKTDRLTKRLLTNTL